MGVRIYSFSLTCPDFFFYFKEDNKTLLEASWDARPCQSMLFPRIHSSTVLLDRLTGTAGPYPWLLVPTPYRQGHRHKGWAAGFLLSGTASDGTGPLRLLQEEWAAEALLQEEKIPGLRVSPLHQLLLVCVCYENYVLNVHNPNQLYYSVCNPEFVRYWLKWNRRRPSYDSQKVYLRVRSLVVQNHSFYTGSLRTYFHTQTEGILRTYCLPTQPT